MKKEEFYFNSKDGKSRIHAVRYMPDTEPVVCVIQIVHGMAEYVERYEEFAEYLTQRGIVVTGEDHLGHGKTVGTDGTLGYICEENPADVLIEDVHSLRKLTQELYPQIPYVMLGHSMGSFITRNYICQYGNGLSGTILMGTNSYKVRPIKAGMLWVKLQKRLYGSKHVSSLTNWLVFGANNREIKSPRTHMDWLSKDTNVVDKYIADPLCGFKFTLNGFEALFELILRMENSDRMRKIPRRLPIYLVSGKQDPIGEFGVGIHLVWVDLRESGVRDVQFDLYPQGRHEILNDVEKEAVTEDIYSWIKKSVLAQE